MVDIKNIRFAYGKGGKNILNDISFHMDDGQCTAILGVNGAGKSTLLKCIDRILRPQGGSVLVDGKDVFSMGSNEMARNIAYVAQNARSVDMTVTKSDLQPSQDIMGLFLGDFNPLNSVQHELLQPLV